MTPPSDQAWDTDPADDDNWTRATSSHTDPRTGPEAQRPARPHLWRWYLRSHFTRPDPQLGGIAVGSLALAAAGLLNVISVIAIVATWRSHLDHDLGPRTARDLYDVGRFAVYPAGTALLILGILVFSRLLRWWLLLIHGLILIAGLLSLAIPPPPL